MVKAITLSFLLFVGLISRVAADTYPEVLFENSVMSGNYAYSSVRHDSLSWVENIGGRLPVSDSVYFTPGNALSLRYASVRGGSWRVTLTYPDAAGHYRPKQDDMLTLKLYVASTAERGVLPGVALLQQDTLTGTVNLADYISDFQPNMWLNVQLPLKAFRGLRRELPISGLQLSQTGADGDVHRLYIDQVEFLPERPPRVKLSSPAVLSAAKAFERHVDLTWQLPLTPSIRYIKIYRSEDNERFEPVAIRPVFVQKCTDFVPQANKTYYYKIAWVDYDYLESPFSNVLKATTETASDEALLDVIQAAHFNYFAERAEVNSGMHAVRFGVDDATVSVMETGLSILSHIVAAERGFLSRTVAGGRLERIVKFLAKADRYHGAFPARIDGRTGKGVYDADAVPVVNLRATAFLMQGLLAARQYFHDAPWAQQVDTLWQEVEWNRFVAEGQEHILLDRWSPVTGFKDAKPMGGFNGDFVSYILALASPRYALAPEAYALGLGIRRQLADSSHVMQLADNAAFSVRLNADAPPVLPRYQEFPYGKDTTVYGLHVSVGTIDTSLLEAYKPFLAFDPRGKRDTFANYYDNHINLTQGYQRRDNAVGTGDPSLDIWGLVTMPGAPDTLRKVSPALACASYAYQPAEALRSIRAFYHKYGEELFTEYGFRKWLAVRGNAVAPSHDALHQAAVVVMVENGRTGLIWNLFSDHPAIKQVVENHFSVE